MGFYPPHPHIFTSPFPSACVASSFLSQGHQSYRISTYLTTFCNLNHCFKTLAPSSPIPRAEGWEFLHEGGEACLLQQQWPLGCGKDGDKHREASELLEKGHFSGSAPLPWNIPFVGKATLFCSPMFVAHCNSKSVTEGLSQWKKCDPWSGGGGAARPYRNHTAAGI